MKIFVKDLREGTFISDQVFSIEEIQQHKTRAQNPYYRLILQDKSGEIVAKIWQDDFPNCHLKNVNSSDVIKIDGEISMYNGQLQLIIKKLDKTDNYDISDLLQASDRNLDEMFTQIQKEIEKLENKDLKKLFKNIFNNDAFVKRFKRTPAAEKVHHDFIGGLMEHILEMIDTAKPMLKYYPEADRDIVTSGIILHDIGKVYELGVKKTALIRTTAGKLIGHIVQGVEFVKEKLPKDFPEKLWLKIEHIIVSHQHQVDNEYGSPTKQATIEAAIVHSVDYASSHVRQFQKAIKLGEGHTPGFSDYQKWIATQVYLD